MRNPVQVDVVTITSQHFILLTGVPSVADDLALGEEKPRWKNFHSEGMKSTSLGKTEAGDTALPGSAEDFLWQRMLCPNPAPVTCPREGEMLSRGRGGELAAAGLETIETKKIC